MVERGVFGSPLYIKDLSREENHMGIGLTFTFNQVSYATSISKKILAKDIEMGKLASRQTIDGEELFWYRDVHRYLVAKDEEGTLQAATSFSMEHIMWELFDVLDVGVTPAQMKALTKLSKAHDFIEKFNK